MHFSVIVLLCFVFAATECSKVVNIKGRLKCKCEKAAGADCQKAKVTLMEDDGGPSYDDELASINVTLGTTFKMSASQFEFFEIEPYLLIDHACPDGIPKVKRINLDPVKDVGFYIKYIDLLQTY